MGLYLEKNFPEKTTVGSHVLRQLLDPDLSNWVGLDTKPKEMEWIFGVHA